MTTGNAPRPEPEGATLTAGEHVSNDDSAAVREMAEPMTAKDRDNLIKLARMNAKVAKGQVAVRERELIADFEAEVAARYRFDHDAWAEIVAAAEAKVAEADRHIAEECRRLGIRPEYRPGMFASFRSCGENANTERMAELRRAAKTQIAAAGEYAKQAIAEGEAAVIGTLLAGALTTEAAKAFLDTMPTPSQLMPRMDLAELEAADAERRRRFEL